VSRGRISLNLIICLEASVFLLLVGLLLAFLPSLREETRPGGGTPVLVQPAPNPAAPAEPFAQEPFSPGMGAGAVHGFNQPPRPDLPVTSLRSSQHLKGLKSVSPPAEAYVSSSSPTVKVEPARPLEWKRTRALQLEKPAPPALSPEEAARRIPI
jgi:hypothetical protein